MASDIMIDYAGDPFNSDAIADGEHPQIVSTGYSGPYADIVCPASPNYPANTPGRYFGFLPSMVDITDTGGLRPILVKDGGTSLTRVTGAPGANQYRIAPATSKMPNIIEFNSGQAGHTISFSYYGTGSIINANRWNSMALSGDLTVDGDINGSLIGDVDSRYISGLVETSKQIKKIIIEIGDWNMDTDDQIAKTFSDLDSSKVRGVSVIIRSDDNATFNSLLGTGIYATGANGNRGGVTFSGSTPLYITLNRYQGGMFDTSDYNATSFNRGWVYIEYEL